MLTLPQRGFLLGSLILLTSLLASTPGHLWVAELKAEAAKPAQLLIHTSPNAEVYLDNSLVGNTGAKGILVIDNISPGEHPVRITLAGKKESRINVPIAAGKKVEIEVPLESNVPSSPVQTRKNAKDELIYVRIPPGDFMMGCSPGDTECYVLDEKLWHSVTITRGFWIGQTPVTVGAYKRYTRATGKSMPPEPNPFGRPLNPGWANDAMPIVDVTWGEAKAYCGWAGGRLPTEAEWEYAARGGSNEGRYGPLDEIAWYVNNSGLHRLDSKLLSAMPNIDERLRDNGNGMHEVGLKRANAFGLFDMLGNVWQWVNDRGGGSEYYQNNPPKDPHGASGLERDFCILRGGSWRSWPRAIRVSMPNNYKPSVRYETVGFRCAGQDM